MSLASNVLIFTKTRTPVLMFYDPSYHMCQCLSWSLLVAEVSSSCIKDLALREKGCILYSLRTTQTLPSMPFTQPNLEVICSLSGKAGQNKAQSFPSRVLGLVIVLTVTEITILPDKCHIRDRNKMSESPMDGEGHHLAVD